MGHRLRSAARFPGLSRHRDDQLRARRGAGPIGPACHARRAAGPCQGAAGAVEIPVSVDAERCFADDAAGVARTVELIAAVGAAGCSIEDFDPVPGAIDPLAIAVERVAAAADTAARHGLVLTARAENHLYGIDDLEDTIERLRAYRDAGAEVLYALGLVDAAQIRRVVDDVGAPINVLALRNAPSVPELAALGVRRVSTGGGPARAAGTSTYLDAPMPGPDLDEAFSPRRSPSN